MSSVEGATEDVIFHHVPEWASSDEGWVKRTYRNACEYLQFMYANVPHSMTVYIMNFAEMSD